MRSCNSSHRPRSRSRATAERHRTEQQVGREQQEGADADQHDKQHDAQDAGRKEHPHALEIEHAAGDQLAGMDGVVERKAEALQLAVKAEPQVIGDAMADRLAEIVVDQREQAAQQRSAEQQQRGIDQGRAGDGTIDRLRAKQAKRLIDRVAEQLRNGQLEQRGNEGRPDGDSELPAIGQRQLEDAPKHARIAARDGRIEPAENALRIVGRRWFGGSRQG
jgi:hypothetical protein